MNAQATRFLPTHCPSPPTNYSSPSYNTELNSTMMKVATLAILAGSASAFAPATPAARSSSVVSLNAEKSASLPFMNRPALVSLQIVSVKSFSVQK